MSNNSAGAENAGALLEDCIAVVLLEEMKHQRYTATQIQELAGVKPRSYANYMVNRSREFPTWAWVSIGGVLRMDEVDVIRRARILRNSLDATQVEILSALPGKLRVDTLRQIAAGRGGGVADPRGRTRADQDDGVVVRSAIDWGRTG